MKNMFQEEDGWQDASEKSFWVWLAVGMVLFVILLLMFAFVSTRAQLFREGRFSQDSTSKQEVKTPKTSKEEEVDTAWVPSEERIVTYENIHFGFKISFPADVFVRMSRMENNTGAVFTNSSSTAALRVYGAETENQKENMRAGFSRIDREENRENAVTVFGLGSDGNRRIEHIMTSSGNTYRLLLSFEKSTLEESAVREIIDSFSVTAL